MKKFHKRAAVFLTAATLAGLPAGAFFYSSPGSLTVWADNVEVESSEESSPEDVDFSDESEAEILADPVEQAQEDAGNDVTETPEVGITFTEPEGWQTDTATVKLIVKMPPTDSNGSSRVTLTKTQDTVYLKEITAPEGYVVQASSYGVKLVVGSTTKQTVTDKEQKGNLTVYKEGEVFVGAVSDENGTSFQYEKRRQKGAVYNIYAAGPYSKDRLKTYSFYLLNENEKSRTDFVKEKYGANKRIHALPDVDDFYVNYDRKGLLLARGDDNSPYASISLSWKKVANRISYLIRNDQFLQAEDYVHMPEYEREQMANKILSFYARLPEGIDRPFTNDFFGAVSRAELMAVLERTEQTEELLQKMDAALAALPLDFEAYGTNYQQKTELLSELHQYVEGTYTIFPTPEQRLGRTYRNPGKYQSGEESESGLCDRKPPSGVRWIY